MEPKEEEHIMLADFGFGLTSDSTAPSEGPPAGFAPSDSAAPGFAPRPPEVVPEWRRSPWRRPAMFGAGAAAMLLLVWLGFVVG